MRIGDEKFVIYYSNEWKKLAKHTGKTHGWVTVNIFTYGDFKLAKMIYTKYSN